MAIRQHGRRLAQDRRNRVGRGDMTLPDSVWEYPMANPLFDALFGGHTGRETVFLHLPDAVLNYDGFLRVTARFAAVFQG